jgi:hypothetical protein
MQGRTSRNNSIATTQFGINRSETELMLACASTHLDADRTARVKALLQGEFDWTYLTRTALDHRVMPLLYRNLQTLGGDIVPQSILKQLQSHYYANAARNLLLAEELLKILHLFEGHKIRAIPYKGPVLAASIYGNLALREFGDLDILVHERDYQSARRLLIRRGFRPRIEHEWEEEFRDGSGRFAVDLHRRIASRDFPSPLNFDYLSKRLRPVDLAGTTAATLCPEDTLLMLGMQVTKDGNLQLSKICDIAELLRVHQQLNWAQVLKETKRLGGAADALLWRTAHERSPGHGTAATTSVGDVIALVSRRTCCACSAAAFSPR